MVFYNDAMHEGQYMCTTLIVQQRYKRCNTFDDSWMLLWLFLFLFLMQWISSKWMAMLEVCMEIGSTIVIYFIWKFSFDRVQNQLFVICILSTTCDVLGALHSLQNLVIKHICSFMSFLYNVFKFFFPIGTSLRESLDSLMHVSLRFYTIIFIFIWKALNLVM